MTGALTWARLSYRQQRWELILVAVGVVGVAVAMVWFSGQLDGLRAASPECLGLPLEEAFPESGPSVACLSILNEYSTTQSLADNLLLLSFAAPFGMGVLLGAPLVAREIDGGTAQLAWSIGRSRTTWLLRRIAFVALAVVVLLGVLAVTSEILSAALLPDRHLSTDFAFFGRRGWLIVVRGVAALAVGMLVGAIIGRVLPAILAAGLVIALAFTGISLAMDRWNETEIVAQRFMNGPDQPADFDMSALMVNAGIETPSGELITYSELYESGVETQMTDEHGRIYTSQADYEAGRFAGYEVQLLIPGKRYPELVAREGAVAGGLGLVALALTTLVVRRRRPV